MNFDQSTLTPRQVEVIQLCADGVPYYAIAYRLGITPGSVKAHMFQIRAALHAKSTAHAVACAIRMNIIE